MSARRPVVTIRRLYDVTCDWCNETVLDGPLLTSRAEADEARRDHIAQHLRDGSDGSHDGAWQSGGAHGEYYR